MKRKIDVERTREISPQGIAYQNFVLDKPCHLSLYIGEYPSLSYITKIVGSEEMIRQSSYPSNIRRAYERTWVEMRRLYARCSSAIICNIHCWLHIRLQDRLASIIYNCDTPRRIGQYDIQEH